MNYKRKETEMSRDLRGSNSQPCYLMKCNLVGCSNFPPPLRVICFQMSDGVVNYIKRYWKKNKNKKTEKGKIPTLILVCLAAASGALLWGRSTVDFTAAGSSRWS
ncbi:hypothetical protein IC575_014428 [Cucumis melo]